jgi:hypothetical protein
MNSEPQEPSYSWQETFTVLLETLLHTVENDLHINLPYIDLRKCLSRAIGFYLFDDVEVPSLVSFTGDEHDVLLSCPKDSSQPAIAAMAFTNVHALWGDPLIETLFMPPGPSQGILEGYQAPLIVFSRQKTKRIWYTVFLALVVLVERGGEVEQGKWAKEVLSECVEQLKDAPCY